MQSYNGKVFSIVYNNELTVFAKEIGAKLLSFYSSSGSVKNNKNILDLGCGTGQVATTFLKAGFQVTGLDLSDDMLHLARENNSDYVSRGQAEFLKCDMANFSLTKEFCLVVATYDAINHLENKDDLFSCFQNVFRHLLSNGYFVFDINTKAALSSWKWKSINIVERKDLVMITRGIFNEQQGKAFFLWTGFYEVGNGMYERFEQTNFNTVFETQLIAEQLRKVGFRKVYFANINDLSMPIENPEQIDQENGLAVIAQK